MSNNRYCADCIKLMKKSGYCCKYKIRLAREKKNGEPVKCIECVMECIECVLDGVEKNETD